MFKLPLSVIFFVSFIGVTSCIHNEEITSSNEAFLIFGYYYGMCIGESYMEILRVEDERLLQDINDLYPNKSNFYEGNFVELGEDKYQLKYS